MGIVNLFEGEPKNADMRIVIRPFSAANEVCLIPQQFTLDSGWTNIIGGIGFILLGKEYVPALIRAIAKEAGLDFIEDLRRLASCECFDIPGPISEEVRGRIDIARKILHELGENKIPGTTLFEEWKMSGENDKAGKTIDPVKPNVVPPQRLCPQSIFVTQGKTEPDNAERDKFYDSTLGVPYLNEQIKKQIRAEQYAICKERGHVGSGSQFATNPPYDICRYCGTGFLVEVTEKLIEVNVPDAVSHETDK